MSIRVGKRSTSKTRSSTTVPSFTPGPDERHSNGRFVHAVFQRLLMLHVRVAVIASENDIRGTGKTQFVYGAQQPPYDRIRLGDHRVVGAAHGTHPLLRKRPPGVLRGAHVPHHRVVVFVGGGDAHPAGGDLAHPPFVGPVGGRRSRSPAVQEKGTLLVAGMLLQPVRAPIRRLPVRRVRALRIGILDGGGRPGLLRQTNIGCSRPGEDARPDRVAPREVVNLALPCGLIARLLQVRLTRLLQVRLKGER